MKKIGQFLLCILPLICALGLQIIVAFIAMIIFGIFQGIKMATSGDTDPNAIANSMNGLLDSNIVLIISAGSAIVCAIVFGIWYRKTLGERRMMNIKEALTFKRILFIILLGVALNSGITVVLSLFESINPAWFEKYNEMMKDLVSNNVISILLTVLIAPISEEIICRGVILENCKKIMPLFAANIMQAILFGVYHMNIIQGIYAFALGLFLGMVCIKTGSIYGAILLHMIFNLSGLVLGNILSENLLPMKVLMIGIFVVSIIIIILSTIKLLKEENKEEDLEPELEEVL